MDPAKGDKLDQEFSEEANYRETMRVVFYGLAPDSSSSSLDGNPFASS